jgi:hypothetical protein
VSSRQEISASDEGIFYSAITQRAAIEIGTFVVGMLIADQPLIQILSPVGSPKFPQIARRDGLEIA